MMLVDAALGSGDPPVLTVKKDEIVTLLDIRRLVGTAAYSVSQLARRATPEGEATLAQFATVTTSKLWIAIDERKETGAGPAAIGL